MNVKRPRLKAITIENFRSIGSASRINLKPITLLFGPNSAGKSSVLLALDYFRDVLDGTKAATDDAIFHSWVHKHDASRRIRLRLEMSVTEVSDLGFGRTPSSDDNAPALVDYFEQGDLWVEGIVGDYCLPCPHAAKAAIRATEVLEYAVGINGAELLRSRFGALSDNCCVELVPNLKHPVFRKVMDDDPRLAPLNDAKGLRWYLYYLDDETGHVEVTHDETEEDERWNITISYNQCIPTPSLRHVAQVGVVNADGARTEQTDLAANILAPLLISMLFWPKDLALDALADITHIGPFRTPPPRGSLQGEHALDWHTGLAAWDLLASESANSDFREKCVCDGEDDPLVYSVGKVLDEMGTGFSLLVRTGAVVDITDSILPLFDHEFSLERGSPAVEYLTAVMRMLRRAPKAREIFLRDLVQKTEIHPQDGAMGIVQLVPVIVALLTAESGTYAIEQPELHLHPAIQCELGSFLARALGKPDGPIAIIETHSEHLLLRLQKLIRKRALTPEMLSVTYFQRHMSGSIVTTLRISEEGEFLDEWPDGFFEEGFKEVFGE
jgi:hypothetical protein